MDRAYIDEHYVIERYLLGKLRDYELAAFELYILDHPEIVEEIQYAAGMQSALENASKEVFAEYMVEKRSQPQPGFWLGRRYAIAVTLLLAIAVGTSGFLYSRLESLSGAGGATIVPSVITGEVWLEPVRSGRAPVIEQSADDVFVLHVDVCAVNTDTYTVEVVGEDTDYAWRKSAIRADGEQSLSLLFPPLATGKYRLTVTSDNGDDTAPQSAQYRFLLQRPRN